MYQSEQDSIKNTRTYVVTFVALLSLSMAFFVSADDTLSGKNIFEDPDNDGLTTAEERLYHTDQNNRDTDGDGYSDGVEVRGGYDPTKPAPGDKIIAEASKKTDAMKPALGVGGDNLTEKVSQDIASLVQNAQENSDGSQSDVSLDDINALVAKAESGEFENITLPDINPDDIKIKKQKYDKLSKEKREAKVREDVVEYLTVLAYIFANNSPQPLSKPEDLDGVLQPMADQVLSSMLSGNMTYLNTISATGEKMLAQIQDVEVPPQMLELHTKALKLALYAVQMKDQLSTVDQEADPIKMIASVSKIQGFLAVVATFMDDAHSAIISYGITEIPVDL